MRERPEGTSVKSVADSFGIHFVSYYDWEREARGEPRKLKPGKAKKKHPGGRPPLEDFDAPCAEVDRLRASGMELEDALLKAGIKKGSYYKYRAGAQRAQAAAHKPKGKGKANGLILAANRAIHKTNGSPAIRSQVGLLTEEFLSRLKAMGAELSKLETDPDGHVTVVVKTTETFRI
jgi:hypothetical protein